MKRIFLSFLWKMDRDEIALLAEQFVQQHYPDIFYDEMLTILQQQKSKNRTTILNSASYEFLVAPIAKKLGFDHYFGTPLNIIDQAPLFPKTVGGSNKGMLKIERMLTLLPKGYCPTSALPLPNSSAYSDHHSDLPILKMCESVTLINPTTRLKKEATNQNWEILELCSSTHPTKVPLNNLKQGLGFFKFPSTDNNKKFN